MCGNKSSYCNPPPLRIAISEHESKSDGLPHCARDCLRSRGFQLDRKWKMCKNPREIMQKVRIWSRIRMCRCYWLHLLLFPLESFATVIQTCTQEQLVWCCVHFALHCTCKTPCCCMEVPNHELTKTSLLQRPFLRHFKHFFHPDRTSPSKWTSVTSPKSAQNHVHESLSSDFKFSFFT